MHRRVSGRALLLMALIGLVAMAAGTGLLLRAGRGAGAPQRYALRLGGVMAAAIGLILIVFAASWPVMSGRPT